VIAQDPKSCSTPEVLQDALLQDALGGSFSGGCTGRPPENLSGIPNSAKVGGEFIGDTTVGLPNESLPLNCPCWECRRFVYWRSTSTTANNSWTAQLSLGSCVLLHHRQATQLRQGLRLMGKIMVNAYFFECW
jgi:hypothetical protein